MIPILTTPPALEPVTLDEARQFLKIDGTAEDDLVSALVVAARLIVEAQSGRMLIQQRWRLVLDAWPASGVLRLPLAPLIAVASARVFNAAGVPSVLAAGLVAPDPGHDPPQLTIAPQVPQPGRIAAGIEIEIDVGFGAARADVPAPLRQAVLHLAARWHENRSDLAMGPQPELPAAVMALIRPYRRARI
jgi:uncharacterized phiE125 gp8 family phage protein